MHTDTLPFAHLLRGAGLKATRQRLDLLEVLSKEKRPLSVVELKQKLPTIDQVTIYRSLEAMCAQYLVRKVDMRGTAVHYELLATRKHHHHVLCSICGMIEDVDACLPKDLAQRVLRGTKNFSEINSHTLEFTGRCKRCAQ